MPDKKKQPSAEGGGGATTQRQGAKSPSKSRRKPEDTRVSTKVDIRASGGEKPERVSPDKLRDGS